MFGITIFNENVLRRCWQYSIFVPFIIGTQAYAGDLSITGTVDLFVGSMKMAGDTSRKTGIGDNGMSTSGISFGGTEVLGSGYSTDFRFSTFMRPSTGDAGRFHGDQFWTEAYLGIRGDFGTIRIGRQAAPSLVSTILANPFGDSYVFSPIQLHWTVGLFNPTNWPAAIVSDTAWSNQLTYTTPKWGGLNATVYYEMGEEGNKNIGFSAYYTKGPFNITGHYEQGNLENPAGIPFPDGHLRRAWLIGGGVFLWCQSTLL